MTDPTRPRDLREDCIIEALAIISSQGVEKLSLREVARRLGVSHQAPYKHFKSRDHILAEIVARAFQDFAQHLDAHPKSVDAHEDMGRMGVAYLQYALTHPLEYRLMFGTPLPDPAEHPEMMRHAKHAFALLCDALKRKGAAHGVRLSEDAIHLDALFIWSGLHGLSSISSSSAIGTLGLEPALMATAQGHLLKRFGDALSRQEPEGGAEPRDAGPAAE